MAGFLTAYLQREVYLDIDVVNDCKVGDFVVVTNETRKESPASSIIIVPISRTEVTNIGPAIFGRICLNIILNVLLPDSLTAIRYVESFCARVSPLASLANFGHPITARAMIAF